MNPCCLISYKLIILISSACPTFWWYKRLTSSYASCYISCYISYPRTCKLFTWIKSTLNSRNAPFSIYYFSGLFSSDCTANFFSPSFLWALNSEVFFLLCVVWVALLFCHLVVKSEVTRDAAIEIRLGEQIQGSIVPCQGQVFSKRLG